MSQALYLIVSNGDGNWIRKNAGPITSWWNRPGAKTKARNWIREHANPVRWISEQVSPEYSEQLDVLREVHNEVKQWTKDLSDILDKAQDARKLGKPLDSIFWLSQINNRLKAVSDEKDKLTGLQDRFIETYFETTDEGIPEDYFDTSKEKIVQAGVLDDLGRQIATWKFQKSHKRLLMEQDRALIKLLNLAKSAFTTTYNLLGNMSKAVGQGDVSEYILILEKVGGVQDKFQSEFRAIYDKYFSAIVDKIKTRKKQQQEEAKKITEDANQKEKERLEREQSQNSLEPYVEGPLESSEKHIELPELEISTDEPPKPSPHVWPSQRETARGEKSDILIDVSAPSSDDLPEPSSESAPTRKKRELPAQTMRSASPMEEMITKLNHEKFYNELKKAAKTNNPHLLAAMMLKYSEEIDERDPEKSLALIAVAEGIING